MSRKKFVLGKKKNVYIVDMATIFYGIRDSDSFVRQREHICLDYDRMIRAVQK